MAKVTRAISLAGYAETVDHLASEAAVAGAEHVLGVSNELVPVKEGHLLNSGRVTRGARYATVSYGLVYARRQHEELTWRHEPGRQAKYLEQPMHTEAETVREIMAAVLRRAAQ